MKERQVKESDGRRWLVREESRFMFSEQTSCLIASSEQAIRRIWSYPAGWETLPDARLVDLINAPVPCRKGVPADSRDESRTAPSIAGRVSSPPSRDADLDRPRPPD